MDHDIIIVGGGPAGISTALHIHQTAPDLVPRILVLEKARYPRPKLCAGALVGDAETLLERLGLDVREVPHTDASTARFAFQGRGLDMQITGRHILRVISRKDFDAWLAAKAVERGITISEGVSVKSITTRASGMSVSTDQGDFTARAVVGADGSGGIVRRSVLPHAPFQSARALEVYTPQNGNGSQAEEEASFDFSLMPDGLSGYIWDFPTQSNGRPSRCRGIFESSLPSGKQRPSLKGLLAEDMRRKGLNLDDYKLEGCAVRRFHPLNKLSVPGILLTGDAAGVDPLLGEGISMALGFGRIAAQTIRDAARKDDYSFRDYRRRLLLSPLGQTLTIRTILSRIMYNHRSVRSQRLLWWYLKPLVDAFGRAVVLNWAKRMR